MKIPPHSDEAEQAILGSVLFENGRNFQDCINQGVTEETFYSPANRMIYGAMVELFRIGQPIDILMLCDHLRKKGIMEQCGGNLHVEQLIDDCPTSANMPHYIMLAKKKERQRFTIRQAIELQEQAYNDDADLDHHVAKHTTNLANLLHSNKGKTMDDYAREQMEIWERVHKGGAIGFPSPWPKFNERFAGLNPKTVTLLVGYASMGKSSLLTTWSDFLGGLNIPHGFLSLEDGVQKTLAKMAGIRGDFSTYMLDMGRAEHHLNRVPQLFRRYSPIPSTSRKARLTFTSLKRGWPWPRRSGTSRCFL